MSARFERRRPSVRRAALATLLFTAAVSCEDAPPRSQFLVHVGTDATLPNFGDRLRVDAIDANGAVRPEATQIFDVSTPGAFPLSFGLVPSSGTARLRFRLYRAEVTGVDGAPLDPVIELVGAIPAAPDGVADLRVALTMACFGKPSDAVSSCDPSTGELAPVQPLPTGSDVPSPGTWGPSNAPCADAPAGMVCVEGGTFLLGSRTFVPFGADFDPVPQQLVHVPTFLIDVDEMTVGAWRALVVGKKIDVPIATSTRASDGDTYCTWTADPAGAEDMPMNCLRRSEAAAGCAALGKRLPTEAEWEFAAGARTEEQPFPFTGVDGSDDICASAVIAVSHPSITYGSRQCIAVDPKLPTGLVPGGNPLDVNALGIHDLGGSVAEWVADDHVPLADGACWGLPIALREDPLCVTSVLSGVVKGGSYVSIAYDAHVHFRQPVGEGVRVSHVGVRCARDL